MRVCARRNDNGSLGWLEWDLGSMSLSASENQASLDKKTFALYCIAYGQSFEIYIHNKCEKLLGILRKLPWVVCLVLLMSPPARQ
jgi:hypothetical protein